jgi:hypothetical protein
MKLRVCYPSTSEAVTPCVTAADNQTPLYGFPADHNHTIGRHARSQVIERQMAGARRELACVSMRRRYKATFCRRFAGGRPYVCRLSPVELLFLLVSSAESASAALYAGNLIQS